MTRDEFIESNLPLVHKLANRFRGRGVEYEELYAAGCVGLVKAADRFEPERGLCFSTYAVPVILGEIRRLFRDGGSVKISRSLKELSVKAARAREELCSRCGGEPRISDIARELGVSRQVIVGDVALLRALAAAAGITEISQKDTSVMIFMAVLDFAAVSACCAAPDFKGRIFFAAGKQPQLTVKLAKGEDALKAAQKLVGNYAIARSSSTESGNP